MPLKRVRADGKCKKLKLVKPNNEGDILIPDEDIFQDLPEYSSGIQKSIVKTSTKWQGGIVRYQIRDDVYDEQKIRDAIAHWASINVDITFIEQAGADIIFITSSGCGSYVGNVNYIGEQPI